LSAQSEFRHLVRIAGKDLEGNKKIVAALSDIRGVGENFAAAVVKKVGIEPGVRIGTLSEQQVHTVEKTLQDVSALSLPQWYYNRRNDREAGETKQLLGSDLDFAIKNDIEAEKTIQSWKGVRHSLGLKVRGQRTRTTGRKGATVGVRKAALAEAAKAAAAEKKEEK